MDGGVLGQLPYNGIIENCYNTATITSLGYYGGGVVGEVDRSTVRNCYNVGTLSGGGNRTGAIVAWRSEGGSIENSFYLEKTFQYACYNNATWPGVTSSSDEYMKSQAFVDALNNGADNWTRDDNINKGYPILKSMKYSQQM